MQTPVTIRLYQPSDRAAIRTLCCDTADLGRPVDSFFPDRELFADFWTRYYTDFEPEHLWVAVSNDRVAGYLTACYDPRRFHDQMKWPILPAALAAAVARGAFLKAQVRRLFWWNRHLWRGSASRDLEAFSGQIHMNVDQSFRGRGLGQGLLMRAIEQAQQLGVAGLQAATRGDNRPAHQFFERMGFRRLLERPGFSLALGKPLPTVVYGLVLNK